MATVIPASYIVGSPLRELLLVLILGVLVFGTALAFVGVARPSWLDRRGRDRSRTTKLDEDPGKPADDRPWRDRLVADVDPDDDRGPKTETSARMKSPIPPLAWALILAVGIGGVVSGLMDASGPQCGVSGLWKCLPGVVLAGRALWIAVGASMAGVAILSLLGGRRPWATAAALITGAVDLAVGGWLLYAVVTGVIPLTDSNYVAWPLVEMLSTIGGGVFFFAAALSDKVMNAFRR